MMSSGSVGAVWPPRHDSHNSRIKGFALQVVRNEGQLDAMSRAISRAKVEFPHAGRVTVRALVERNLRSSMNGNAPAPVEAFFSADRFAPGHDIVYFGQNRGGRISSHEEIRAETEALNNVLSSVRPVSRQDAFARVEGYGYRIEQIDKLDTNTLQQLLALYRQTYKEYTFNINEGNIRGMVSNGNIVLGAFTPAGRIAAAMVAEHASVGLSEGRMPLYELSDYATDPQDRGRGLMTAMQLRAVDIVRSNEPSAIIYIESRAPWDAVNASIVQTGEFEYRGTLLQHCRMNSVRNNGLDTFKNFENLHVWSESSLG